MHIKLNTWRLGLSVLIMLWLVQLEQGLAAAMAANEEVADSTWSHYTSAELFMEGSILMEEEFWHEAERVWAFAIESRPKNRVLKYRRAICLFEMAENWVETKAAFEEVVNGQLTLRYDPFNPNQKLPPFEAWLDLASTEHRLGEFGAARKHVDEFLALAGEKHPSMERASKILAELRFAELQLSSPTAAIVSPVSFNSEAHESHPVMTADGRTLFFSSNRSRSNGSNHGRVDPNTKEHYHDIYRTELQVDSTWSDPELLNVGLRFHATVVGSDAFGDKLVVLDNDGWTHELKMTTQWERGWTVAEPFLIDKNIPTQGEIVFFPQKDRLVASVKTRRGEGGFDLYESSLGENGNWSKLKSLGSRVNTWGDEVTPFVAADGQTLFFASNGLQSMGGYDIYRTTRNAAGGWTEPEHLGSPINSVDDDLAFVIGAKGEVGYFATRREVTRGDLDLYEAHLNGSPALEEEVVVLSLNAEGVDNVDQPAVLLVKDAETGAVVQRVEKGGSEDVFHFILPTGRDFIVESEDVVSSTSSPQTTIPPAVRRRISLPETSKAEVIDVTFEEVFLQVETEPSDDEKADAWDDVFVVQPRPSVPETVASSEETSAEPELESELESDLEPSVEPAESELATSDSQVVSGATNTTSDSSDLSDPEEGLEVGEAVAEAVESSNTKNEEKPAVKPAVQPSGNPTSQRSEPIAPMALNELPAASMILAVQLYSGQVHTDRMDLGPVLDAVMDASNKGKAVLRIEGSASDGPSTRAGGNMELASSRAMDVYLRVVRGLEARGLTKGDDYTVRVVRRVQPDGDTPATFKNSSTHPASFQYVRVDLSVE